MSQKKTEPTLSELYELDETAWLEEMARLASEGRWDSLDSAHLSEFLRDMAMRDRREVLSRLKMLLTHLLKWDYQASRRTTSWEVTIAGQRDELGDLLESATLRLHAEEVLPKACERAVRQAVGQTGLSKTTFPAECPWTLDQILAES